MMPTAIMRRALGVNSVTSATAFGTAPPRPMVATKRSTSSSDCDPASPVAAVRTLKQSAPVIMARLRPNRSPIQPNRMEPTSSPNSPVLNTSPIAAGVMPHCLISTGAAKERAATS